jgi:hypothetical protein
MTIGRQHKSALGQKQTLINPQNSTAKPFWQIRLKPLERVKGI